MDTLIKFSMAIAFQVLLINFPSKNEGHSATELPILENSTKSAIHFPTIAKGGELEEKC